MLQEQSIAIAAVEKPMLEELIVVFTHNQNDQFRSYARTNPEITRVIYLNDKKEFNSEKQAAFRKLLNTIQTEIIKTPARLITLAMDFNLGYSGLNISPISEIKATLEAESTLAFIKNLFLTDEEEPATVNDYVFINTQDTLADAKNKGKIPFRFILTGSGGENVADNYDKLENLNPTEACVKYSFQTWPIMKFLSSMRRANGGTPLPMPASPQSVTRRLGLNPTAALIDQKTTQRTSSSSTTSASSPSFANGYEFSPSSRASSSSTNAVVHPHQEVTSPNLTSPLEFGRSSSETSATADSLTASEFSVNSSTSRLKLFGNGTLPKPTMPSSSEPQNIESTANYSPPSGERTTKRPSPIKTPERKHTETATEVPALVPTFRKLQF